MTILNIVDGGAKGDGTTDNTSFIQNVVDKAQSGDTVVVPPGNFMINPIANSNVTMFGSNTGIVLKSGITLDIEGFLQAIPNSSSHYVMLAVQNVSDLVVTGKGKIIGDHDKHTTVGNPSSEWGHGIFINQSQNITVNNGLNISKCHGDGLAVMSCDNLAVDHVVFDSNYRQSFSVSSINGMKVTNSTFSNAGMVALDLEPEFSGTIQNVLIQYNNFQNSGLRGAKGSKKVHIGIGSEANIGTFKNIKVINDQFDDRQQPIWVHGTAGTTGIPPWAAALNAIFYQGMKADWYRFWGYPTSWTKA